MLIFHGNHNITYRFDQELKGTKAEIDDVYRRSQWNALYEQPYSSWPSQGIAQSTVVPP